MEDTNALFLHSREYEDVFPDLPKPEEEKVPDETARPIADILRRIIEGILNGNGISLLFFKKIDEYKNSIARKIILMPITAAIVSMLPLFDETVPFESFSSSMNERRAYLYCSLTGRRTIQNRET